MSNETLTRRTEVDTPGRRSPLLWIPGLVAALAVGVVVGWLVFGGQAAESTVDAQTEQEINALIDDWLTARNTADGELAESLFTADGRYVGGNPGLAGWSGADLRAGIERYGGAVSAERLNTLIIERPNAYYVALRFRPYQFGNEFLALFNIVDEGGALKIRYTNDWMANGWVRLADGLPYQPISLGDTGLDGG